MRLSRTTLADKIKDQLLKRVVKGKYRPGEWLREQTLAKEFGVSQTPVREALQILESMKLVESQPNRGMRIREITVRELNEARIVRGALEEVAAKTAAGPLQEQIETLKLEHSEMLRCLEAGDPDGLARHAVNFHGLIVRNCGNKVLIETWESLAFEARSCISAHTTAQSVMRLGVGLYDGIVAAFCANDGVLAGRLLREQAEVVSRALPQC